MNPRALRIVVAGRLAAAPGQGGAAWAILQWVLGLRSLGHEVWLVEPLSSGTKRSDEDDQLRSRQTRYFRAVARRFGLADRALLTDGHGLALDNSGYSLANAISKCDLLADVSGVLAASEIAQRVPVRLFVDLDPGFTQLWNEAGVDVGLDGHTHFATVGQRIGEPQSRIPARGKTWIHFLPPVALDYWPAVGPPPRERFTTVANWRSYGSIERDGVFFGQKAHSFREHVDLPSLTDARLEVALDISPGDDADRDNLQRAGWKITSPRVASTPDAYQRFIHRSSAEIGLAKSGYVAGRTGWFSDRSAAYLASGRPVVAQDTGIPALGSDGFGFVRFGETNAAAEGIERIRSEYPRHAKAARGIAAEHLDAKKVFAKLLRQLGMTQ